MPQANLTLKIPNEIWIGEISRMHPDAKLRILSALPDEESGVGLAEITATRLKELLSDIQSHESVVSLDILSNREETALVQFETSNPHLLMPVRDSGIPLEMPFTLTGGKAKWEITASRTQLSELGRQLEKFGIPFDVNRIQKNIVSDRLITQRQREIVTAAVDAGYYDTPRECSLTELSETLGIAKSTCSETLHRAEEEIIKKFTTEQEDPQRIHGSLAKSTTPP